MTLLFLWSDDIDIKTMEIFLTNSSKYLFFGVYFSIHQGNIVYNYKLHKKPIEKEIQIDIHFL